MIYYTLDSGNRPLKLVPFTQFEHCEADEWKFLYSQGQEIQTYLHELLVLLRDGTSPLAIRLQNGRAAACSNHTPEEFDCLNEQEKAKLRVKYNRLWNHLDAMGSYPHVVLYLGGPRIPTMSSLPSMSSTLRLSDSLKDPDPKNEKENENELDFEPWHADWDDVRPPKSCPWGWHVRTIDTHRHYVFLSGAFVAWRYQYTSGFKSAMACSDRDKVVSMLLNEQKLDIFLKITLYHELVHKAITDSSGPDKRTPERVIDHPKAGRSDGKGEAGRVAEAVAFGGVTELMRSGNKEVTLYTTDYSSETPASFPITNVESYFNNGLLVAPLSLQDLRITQPGIPRHSIVQWELTKALSCEEPAHNDEIKVNHMLKLKVVVPAKSPEWPKFGLPSKGGCVEYM